MTAADESEILEDGDDVEEKALTLRRGGSESTGRRRQASGSRRRRSARRGGETDDEGEGGVHDDDERGDAGFLGVLKKTVGRRAGDSQFSFQVHHHHAPGMGGMQQPKPEAQPERWMRSNTPYVLLGSVCASPRASFAALTRSFCRSYLQFGSLTLLAILVLSLLSLFLYTLYNDIQARLAELTVELRSEIVQCAKAYVDNFCQEKRMPALARQCVEWEECMHKEVVVVGKTRVVAETLAEVVNGFVDVISLKTMVRAAMLPVSKPGSATDAVNLRVRSCLCSSRSGSRSTARPLRSRSSPLALRRRRRLLAPLRLLPCTVTFHLTCLRTAGPRTRTACRTTQPRRSGSSEGRSRWESVPVRPTRGRSWRRVGLHQLHVLLSSES